MKLLTNLIFEPKGKHDPALTYSIKDTVMSPDGSKVYFALRDVPSGIALTDEDYWMLQIDLSSSKNAMDEAVAAFSDYAKIVGTRVKGETAKATGNPATFLPDAGSLLQPVTVLEPQQAGSGDPYPAGGGRNLIPFPYMTDDKTENGVTFTVQDDGGIKVNGTATGVAYFNLCEVHFSDINMSTAGTFTDGNVCISGAAGGVNIGYSVGNSKMYLFTPSSGAIDTVVYPQVEKGSTPTEYAPYSNIRPFIGYDKLGLNHVGKNLVPWPYAMGGFGTVYENNGLTAVVNDDYSITVNGTATGSVYLQIGTMNLGSETIIPGGTNGVYVLSERVRYNANTGMVSINFSAGNVVDNQTFYPQIEFGTAATQFEPPRSTLHTVQIGQTVYGGRFDWLTGKLAADIYLFELNVSDMNNDGDYPGWRTVPGLAEIVGVGLDTYMNVSGGFVASNIAADAAAFGVNTVNGNETLYLRKVYFGMTQSEWKAKHPDLKVQIAVRLKTPIEIQLTPHILTAVEPEQNNTLYGDGTIEVEYVKPLHVSIEERVAAALAAAAE